MLEQIAQLCSDKNLTFSIDSYMKTEFEFLSLVYYRWQITAKSWSYASSGFKDLDTCLSGLLLYLQRLQ